MDRKTLGIIGGVGPMATAYFMEKIVDMTESERDQDNIDMIVLNHCSIPDRTAYILDHSKDNPGPVMAADAKKLQQMGAGVIVTPCNTAHYFHEEIESGITVPFLNMIELTAQELKMQGAETVGVMATTGTVQTGLFQRALCEQGITGVVPAPRYQQKVMMLIYDEVKANAPVTMEDFYMVAAHLKEQGCDRIILGCTELSVIKQQYHLSKQYIDSLDVLAVNAIKLCGYPVSEKALSKKGLKLFSD